MQASWCPPQECRPPQEGGPMSMVPSCSKWSCGPHDPCSRVHLLSPPSQVPGSCDASWSSLITVIAAVAPVPLIADTDPGDCPCPKITAGAPWVGCGSLPGCGQNRRRIWSRAGVGLFLSLCLGNPFLPPPQHPFPPSLLPFCLHSSY